MSPSSFLSTTLSARDAENASGTTSVRSVARVSCALRTLRWPAPAVVSSSTLRACCLVRRGVSRRTTALARTAGSVNDGRASVIVFSSARRPDAHSDAKSAARRAGVSESDRAADRISASVVLVLRRASCSCVTVVRSHMSIVDIICLRSTDSACVGSDRSGVDVASTARTSAERSLSSVPPVRPATASRLSKRRQKLKTVGAALTLEHLRGTGCWDSLR